MPIDPDYKSKLQKTGMHHQHDVWGEKAERPLDMAGYEAQIKANIERDGYTGIHGSVVAVDFDLCIADGACLPVCPVAVFEWLKKPGDSTKDGKLDESDKSDPIREADCIFCMACETVCPTVAIKIYQP